MKIGVIGLGLIGGSMALALTEAGHEVYGLDRDEIVCQAMESGAIKGKLQDLTATDVVWIATPPSACAEILKKGGFRKEQIVADVCGIKRALKGYGQTCGGTYVGCHPMAGREVSGFRSAQAGLFRGASMILTDVEGKEAAAEILEKLSRQMGFARIVRCDSALHDQKIAYTSQLAHVVSNAYVKSPTANGYLGFTGGSFQDMTRIADLNGALWVELFAQNRDYLSKEIRTLIASLTEYADALDKRDDERLKKLLEDGSKQRRKIKWSKN